MYPRQITERIIELQAKGFSAEETRLALKEQNGISIGLATVYRHRTGTLANEITEETLRQQQRDILRQQKENPKLALQYRNELLKLLIPQRIESYSHTESYTKNETTINVPDLLKQYEDLFEEATILEHCAPKPLHPPQANSQTSPSTTNR